MSMSIFLGLQCAFVFPIYVRIYRKYSIDQWKMVYTVCFRGDFAVKTVVGFLRLNSFEKMAHVSYAILFVAD